MIESIRIDDVMRALADPTRRGVFERIAHSEEINVAELTRASGVTQGAVSQHLKLLKQAGLVVEGLRTQRFLPGETGGPRRTDRLVEPL